MNQYIAFYSIAQIKEPIITTQKKRWKKRTPNRPDMIEGEEPWGNGCENYGCLDSSTHVANCFDDVVRELCPKHYESRNKE